MDSFRSSKVGSPPKVKGMIEFFIRTCMIQFGMMGTHQTALTSAVARKKALSRHRPCLVFALPCCGGQFNRARLREFADDAAVVAHTRQQLQRLMNHFSQDSDFTTSLEKTNMLGEVVDAFPNVSSDKNELETLHKFSHLVSSISDNLSLDAEINRRIILALANTRTTVHLSPVRGD